MDATAQTLTVQMLSRYPTSASASGQRGLATYTRMLAESLAKLVPLTILADAWEDHDGSASATQGAYRVRRIWHEGPGGLMPVLKDLLTTRQTPHVFHVQHEYLGYGHIASNGILLPILFLCKLRGISPVVTFHGLLTEHNMGTLQFGDYGYTMPAGRLRRIMKLWVRCVGALSAAIVVHEDWQRAALVNEYHLRPSRVHRIPHGIPEEPRRPPKMNPSMSRRPKVLFFGYLAPYKGLEILLQTVAGIGSPDFELLIAGDVSPRARGNPEYEQYLKRIDELIAATKGRARKIGFVPNEEVEALLKSVDLVVFPYTSVLSSSGPLALAMAYGTPLLATRELFEEGALCVYDGTVADLRTKLERFLLHPELRELAAAELVSFRSGRTWSHIAELHREVYLHVGAKT